MSTEETGQREQQKSQVSLESGSKLPNFCWLPSYLPPLITPRRKKNGQNMKKKKKSGTGRSCLTKDSLSPML
jgi:hypothetical protein